MSTMIDIRGVPVQFPFEPYDIQKDYMEKVIECLQTESVAVLESPTGTGKTLCLLCSSLAWLQLKKAQLQAQRQTGISSLNEGDDYLEGLKSELAEKAGEMAAGRMFLGVPQIIYASRTHTQLSQAMQELKRSAYSHMKASVLGSRDQLCIHPEVKAETDAKIRIQMCRLKLTTRSCHYNNKVEQKKDDPEVCNTAIIDIEDMIKLGTKHTFCPYYMTKELKQRADIVFAPYNYLLDPIARKALGVNLNNSIIILDEGHNIEKVCEETASVELKTTDLVVATDELTTVMKQISENPFCFDESDKDINPEYVANFKEILLKFIDVVYEIPLNQNREEVTNFPGDYIFGLLEQATITGSNFYSFVALMEKMIQLLASNSGPFGRKGKGLQLFSDFLTIVFASKASKEKIGNCYKVHVKEEAVYRKENKTMNTWLSSTSSNTGKVRILCFWCFSPGFGMDLIMNQSVRAVILTSGTLAPLKPFISELELNVTVRLENPHIVKGNQICVKVLPVGPDGEPLNSNYQNRDNPRYVSSLGRAIVNLSRIIPNGLLIFFPSYPIMQKCQNMWQAEGIWTNIMSQKAIFVEPRNKDDFNAAMLGYYEKIRDPNLKGAIFMAVCRGKVSEGLDFADANGRAVIITGLPYPPLKDARVILKRRYLDQRRAKDSEFLSGSDWYSLEASRAVNQAIGRVIRHRHDYGAILLLDQRFSNFRIKEQMSKWLKDHVQVVTKYGEVIRDLSQFFRKAQSELPAPVMKQMVALIPPEATFDSPQSYSKKGNFNFGSSSASQSNSVISSSDDSVSQYIGASDNPNGTVAIHSSKRENLEPLVNCGKKKKIQLMHKQRIVEDDDKLDKDLSISQYVAMVRSKLEGNFKPFADALKLYSSANNLGAFLQTVDPLVPQDLRYIFIGLYTFIRTEHKNEYVHFLRRNNLPVPEDY